MGTLPDLTIEENYWKDFDFVAGIDEVGRGAIAGPVVAAAVIFPKGFTPDFEIDDSKKLSQKKREEYSELIKTKALAYSTAMLSNEEIDTTNILKATMAAMAQAVSKINIKPDFLLVDGNYYSNTGLPFETIVKGDSKSVSIAAASIIAKVKRDNWMSEFADNKFPGYDFSNNKGYGTKVHFEHIEIKGPCKIHRMSFLKKFYNKQLTIF